MTVTTALVLCAGRGSRLRPYTDTTPKPLLPVNGKPTLQLLLESLHHAGIKKVCLVVHHLAEQIESFAKEQSVFSAGNIACVKQETMDGTASAAACALTALPTWFVDGFLLTASDYIVPIEFYRDLFDAHRQGNRDIAVSLKRVPTAELSKRSSVRLDNDGNVLEVVEKPAEGCAPSPFSANLIYVLPGDIVNYIHAVPQSARGEYEVQSAINAHLKAQGPGVGLEQAVPAEWQPGMQ